LRQGAVAIGRLALKELRRALDAGERIFDFVREHSGKA
jgi:hypothetical protein